MVQYKIYEIEKTRDFWFQDARIKNISTVSFSSSHFFFLKKKKSKIIGKARKKEAHSPLMNQGDINNPKPEETKMESGWKDGA